MTPPRFSQPAGRPRPGAGAWLARLALAALLLSAAGVALRLATEWARAGAVKEIAAQARSAGQLNAALLRNNLDKFRTLPFVLARDEALRATLRNPQPAQILTLDEKLDALSRGVSASAIYVLDHTGYAIAASNWREPATFAGVDYQFRPYFKNAATHGYAEHFALGTVSHEAGLYLARRVDDARGAMLGVVVLKVDFRALEADWRQSSAPIFVTDEHGIVLLGSNPAWRFSVLEPLPPDLARGLRASLQFGDAPFLALPFSPLLRPESAAQLVNTHAPLPPHISVGAPLLHTTVPITESPDWTLHLLTPVESAVNRTTANAQLGVLLALAVLGTASGIAVYRRHLHRTRASEQAAIQRQLTAQVEERTAQLRETNERLVAEMDERQRATAQLHTMQDELVQASKLALLGQISAGVAHEINQPVAAIRAYADNAREFLARRDMATASENLEAIASLTERIGNITGELRAFSRKAGDSLEPTSLNHTLEGALLLVGPRARRQNVALPRPLERDFLVQAHPLRLEQVLVNLLQNALEAMENRPSGRIGLAVREDQNAVRLYVGDDGPGLTAEARGRLFIPFLTTKPEGLGLGLVISRDIAAEFSGELRAAEPGEPLPAGLPGGAVFVLTLRKAQSGAAGSNGA